jgi:Galactose oxidase-like, Early set domain
MFRARRPAVMSACALVTALTATTLFTATPTSAHGTAGDEHRHGGVTAGRLKAAVDADEARMLGEEHAREHARVRLAAQAVEDEYPQPMRTRRLEILSQSQQAHNRDFAAFDFGRFAQYFQSPDFGDHIALLPTGKVLLFSFERIETDPTKEPAPTNVIGARNAGRAWLWDPSKGYGATAFTKVTPPSVVIDDGTGVSRPAPFFCAGHAFLPNGMLGVFGGNAGGNGGAGAKLSLVFDPWTETWAMNQDMATGRWYPSVVTGADGKQLIMSGQIEIGWGWPTDIVERFPGGGRPVPFKTDDIPRFAQADVFDAKAPFKRDYPHLFSLRDGKIYGLGRNRDQQWLFDPVRESRTDLPARPDKAAFRNYGSAVPLPGGFRGPDSVLVLGGDRDDPNTYRLQAGRWEVDKPRAFGRTQDDTLLLPDGNLMTVNGAFDIRDYGNGDYNPNGDLKYRQIELRDTDGTWKLGPVQRLPRGYHSNAVVLPDGRVLITGDELQQLANDPDVKDDMNGTIEIYEPAYLHSGSRPNLGSVPSAAVHYDETFDVTTSTPGSVERAVLLAPTTSTHSVNTSQRHLELRLKGTGTSPNSLRFQAPPSAAAAPPGWYMLFLLDEEGVPSTARWVQLTPKGV